MWLAIRSNAALMHAKQVQNSKATEDILRVAKDGGPGWIRTSEGISRQIYSLMRLATSLPTHVMQRKNMREV